MPPEATNDLAAPSSQAIDSGGGGPVAVVTGAGTGIGRALCDLLSARGYRLVLVGRRRAPLEAAAEQLDTETMVLTADMALPEQAASIVDAAVGGFGRIDALVNNAGVGQLAPIDEHTPEMIRATLDANTLGPAVAIARAWPTFVEQGSGCIVNVSSRASIDPFPGFFAYAASKAAVNLLARSAASEGAAHGIRAFAVAPGAVETPLLRSLFDESALPRSAAMEPGVIAAVIDGCIAGDHDDTPGETIHVSADTPAGAVLKLG